MLLNLFNRELPLSIIFESLIKAPEIYFNLEPISCSLLSIPLSLNLFISFCKFKIGRQIIGLTSLSSMPITPFFNAQSMSRDLYLSKISYLTTPRFIGVYNIFIRLISFSSREILTMPPFVLYNNIKLSLIISTKTFGDIVSHFVCCESNIIILLRIAALYMSTLLDIFLGSHLPPFALIYCR